MIGACATQCVAGRVPASEWMISMPPLVPDPRQPGTSPGAPRPGMANSQQVLCFSLLWGGKTFWKQVDHAVEQAGLRQPGKRWP